MPKYSTDSGLVGTDTDPDASAGEPATETPPSPSPSSDEATPDQEPVESDGDSDEPEQDIDATAGHATVQFYESMIRDAVTGIVSVDLIQPDDPDRDAFLDVQTRTSVGKVTLERLLTEDADDGGLNVPLYVNVEAQS